MKMTDTGRCPLCQGDNACGLVQATPDPCWCVARKFPRAIFDEVPNQSRGRACICESCLDQYSHRL